MKIEIKIERDVNANCYKVIQGDRYTSELTWDEMLGQIAKLTLIGERLYPMRTKKEWAEQRDKLKHLLIGGNNE